MASEHTKWPGEVIVEILKLDWLIYRIWELYSLTLKAMKSGQVITEILKLDLLITDLEAILLNLFMLDMRDPSETVAGTFDKELIP